MTVEQEPTRVLIEQVRALDVERLDRFVGRVDARQLSAIDEALELVLGLR